MPTGQTCFGAPPPGQYMPGRHVSHTAEAVDVLGVRSEVPAWQTCVARHTAWLRTFVNVPSAQPRQTRSVTLVPGMFTNEPGSHALHAAQDGALITFE